MSISALSSSSAASQLNYLNRANSATSGTTDEAPRGAPPPGRPDGGGFIGAIADALKAIGISADGTGSATTTSAGSTTASTDSSDSSAAGGGVAQALGSFLQSLMGALHAQGAGSSDGGAGSDAPPPPAYGDSQGDVGGPGKLGSDLQSLISKLTSSTSTDTSSDTSTADASADVTDLESTFKNLLDQLTGTSTDSADANTKLASFLQALSGNLQGGGSSGNLINTTV